MKTFYPTGNDYVALPTIAEDGSVESMNYLSMRDRGIIEWTGEPFLKPLLMIDGERVAFTDLKWRREHYWIPTFEMSHGDLEIRVKYVAPMDAKGWFLRYELRQAPGSKEVPADVRVGIEGHFGQLLHSINESKPIEGTHKIYKSLWNDGWVFDFRTGVTMNSFAFITAGGFTAQQVDHASRRYTFEKQIQWREVPGGREATVDMFMGVGFEEVGATTQAIHLLRETGDHLIQALESWLVDRVQPHQDPHLMSLLNLNQFFNYFYATGYTLDTEERVLCTSRSPRYYVSAAYWDRDSLIWSFPALLVTEPRTAREALDYVFGRQMRNIGIHSRYIDGTVLEPGFELDELCAPLLAIDMYLERTGDWAYAERQSVRDGVAHIVDRLVSWKHPSIDLFGTFLMPTDDMRRYPYLTYNNVLVWRILGVLERLYTYWGKDAEATWAKELRIKVREAVNAHLTMEEDGRRFYAWSSDLQGHHDFYDEPPGSLTLLSYYGFVDAGDAVFRNTVERLYHEDFPHYFNGTAFEELGCSHADHPWVLAICNSLLNGREEQAMELLRRTNMDNGIACESIDENTGEWVTGAHFATCAGFLVHALMTTKGR